MRLCFDWEYKRFEEYWWENFAGTSGRETSSIDRYGRSAKIFYIIDGDRYGESRIRVNGTAEITGLIVLASQGEKNMIGMKFDSLEYQFEKLGYDGETFSVGYAKAGVRTRLDSYYLKFQNL